MRRNRKKRKRKWGGPSGKKNRIGLKPFPREDDKGTRNKVAKLGKRQERENRRNVCIGHLLADGVNGEEEKL